TNKQ
ncbi:hypothetical protein VCHENC02_1477, partial [Vibrio harveyi]